MVKETDIAWLAGIVDGEGCFTVKRPIVRKTFNAGRKTSYQVWLVVCNTSQAMVVRMAEILRTLGIRHQPIRRVWKGKLATRWQFWLHVARKHELLALTEALLPHLTAKKVEAEAVCWFLRRACREKYYRANRLDGAVLDSLSAVKRNGGEAPAEVLDLLRAVIPSQALEGSAKAEGSGEGVETRGPSPNSNDPHERPGTQVN
jgi:hypothetical protein